MAMTIRAEIAQAVEDRGYFRGFSAETMLIRQVCKLMEELGELVIPMDIPSLPITGESPKYEILKAALLARRAFDSDIWHGAIVAAHPNWDAIRDEIADCYVVLSIMERMINRLDKPWDMEKSALIKATADRSRGVRVSHESD